MSPVHLPENTANMNNEGPREQEPSAEASPRPAEGVDGEIGNWTATIAFAVLSVTFCAAMAWLQTANLFAGPEMEPTARELYVQRIWRWEILGSLCVAAWLNCLFVGRSRVALVVTGLASLAFAGGPFVHYLLNR